MSITSREDEDYIAPVNQEVRRRQFGRRTALGEPVFSLCVLLGCEDDPPSMIRQCCAADVFLLPGKTVALGAETPNRQGV